MSESTSEIRQEMAETRDRMSRDIDQLEAAAAEKVRAVKQRLDIGQLVRDHPWPALGAAVVLGALVGGSGADEKAAVATVAGAKAAASASRDAVSGVVEKLHSSDDAEPEALTVEPPKPGLGERLFDGLGAIVARALDGVIEDMRHASRDWGARMAGQSRVREPMPVTTTTTVVAVAEPILTRVATSNEGTASADEVPVPREMLPTEVDARADAVEALGGGTHEPPLAPGAGDLGARWA